MLYNQTHQRGGAAKNCRIKLLQKGHIGIIAFLNKKAKISHHRKNDIFCALQLIFGQSWAMSAKHINLVE